MRLRGAHISGRLLCTGARLNNRSGPALHATRLQVDGSVQLKGVTARGYGPDGAVLLYGARLGGRLECDRVQLANRAGPALEAEMLQVGEAALFPDAFSATGHGDRGAVRLPGAQIGTRLELGSGMCNPCGPVLDLQLASVKVLQLSPEVLSRSRQASSRPNLDGGWLLLDGLTYTTIPSSPDLSHWLKWLRHATPYGAQPYQQLASVHSAAGDHAKAREILIAQQDDLGDRGKLGGRLAKPRHWLLGKTIGYGYRTWLAFVGLAAVLVLAGVLGLVAGNNHGDNRWVAAHTDKAGTAQAGTACSTAEQIGLGVERAIPLFISNTGIRDRCALDSSSDLGQVLTAAGWVLQLAAWALATLAIAGYTGLVRKT